MTTFKDNTCHTGTFLYTPTIALAQDECRLQAAQPKLKVEHLAELGFTWTYIG